MAAKKILFQNILTYLQKNRPIQCRNFMYRTYDNLKQNDMVKVMGSAESRRYVLKKDGLGYSMHLTLIGKMQLQFSDLCFIIDNFLLFTPRKSALTPFLVHYFQK